MEQWNGEFHHIPVYIQYWSSHSWKKIFTEYLVSQEKYFVFPRVAYTTNPGEVGTNYSSKVDYFNTALSEIGGDISFATWERNSLKYDASFEIHPDLLKLKNNLLEDKEF